jgi:hypothetical protein
MLRPDEWQNKRGTCLRRPPTLHRATKEELLLLLLPLTVTSTATLGATTNECRIRGSSSFEVMEGIVRSRYKEQYPDDEAVACRKELEPAQHPFVVTQKYGEERRREYRKGHADSGRR